MAVFEVAQSVVAQSAGLVQGTTDITSNMLANMQATIEGMELGPLLGLWTDFIACDAFYSKLIIQMNEYI